MFGNNFITYVRKRKEDLISSLWEIGSICELVYVWLVYFKDLGMYGLFYEFQRKLEGISLCYYYYFFGFSIINLQSDVL